MVEQRYRKPSVVGSIPTFGSVMLRFLHKHSYRTLNQIAISKQALFTNHQNIQAYHKEAQVCPVLKSNAYGHGLKEMAQLFDSMHCPFLVVDSLFEAYELYKLKIKTPILIMGYTAPENFKIKKLPFEIVVFDLRLAEVLNRYQKHCKIHLFIDTGMNREGIKLADFPQFLSAIKKLKNLQIVGLCSHLADADNSSSFEFTQKQIDIYKEALNIMEQFGINSLWRHISASGGSFKIKDNTFNMLRVGLAHYGINPLDQNDTKSTAIALEPVLEFSSTLVQVKNLSKGDLVGYNCTFKAKKNTTIGLLPAGYYEGVDRRLSNLAFVKIRNEFFPIIGRVSMNMTTIDISKLKNPKIGEKVIVYSSLKKDKNNLSKTATLLKTIPYELLVHLAESVKRVVVI